MTFFSIPFLIWAGLGLIFYYALPKKSQWIVLLCVSLGFYFYAGWVLFLIFAVQVLTVYLFALSIPKLKGKAKKAVFALEIVIMLAALVLIKLGGAALGPIKIDLWMGFGWNESSLIIPLGISYYTLMLISYSIDVFREDIVPERNFFKLLLFAGFFPSVVQGPFNRYNDLAPQFYEPHKFAGEEFAEGFLRFGWGIFKKMVVANRIAVLVNNIWNTDKAPGIYVLLALLLYVFQLYADFSGFIDTSIGVAKMFGISVPENFEKPYFSRSIAAFWRRWHITLGEWFKDYVFYPVSMSAAAKKYIAGAGNRIKASAAADVAIDAKTGERDAASADAASALTKEQKEKIKTIKKRRQKVVLCVSLLAVWICNGLWHGLGVNFLVMGLYFGAVVIITTLLEPVSKAFGKKHPKLSAHPLWHFWQQVRTYVLIMVGTTLLNVASVGETIERWGRVFTDLRFTELFGERFWKFGLTPLQWALLAAGLLVMLIVSILETKFNKKITALVMDRKIVVRFIIYWVVLALILLSLNIENAEFIYASF